MTTRLSRNKLCVLLAVILIPFFCSCTHTKGQQAAPNFELSLQFSMPLEVDSSDGKSAAKSKAESETSEDTSQPSAASRE